MRGHGQTFAYRDCCRLRANPDPSRVKSRSHQDKQARPPTHPPTHPHTPAAAHEEVPVPSIAVAVAMLTPMPPSSAPSMVRPPMPVPTPAPPPTTPTTPPPTRGGGATTPPPTPRPPRAPPALVIVHVFGDNAPGPAVPVPAHVALVHVLGSKRQPRFLFWGVCGRRVWCWGRPRVRRRSRAWFVNRSVREFRSGGQNVEGRDAS